MTEALRSFRRKAFLPLCQRIDEGGRILGRAVKLQDRTRLAGLADPVESANERLKVGRLRTDCDGNFQFAKRGFQGAVEVCCDDGDNATRTDQRRHAEMNRIGSRAVETLQHLELRTSKPTDDNLRLILRWKSVVLLSRSDGGCQLLP